ncbi:GTP-binding protein GEM [Trichonephila clavipes]|nr:GTP-binding protein GEM [Trichonephila clavipes]
MPSDCSPGCFSLKLRWNRDKTCCHLPDAESYCQRNKQESRGSRTRQHDRQVAQRSSKTTPTWLYRQDFTKFPLNHHFNILEAMKEEADAYIVVYSVTDRASFEKAVDILFSLRERGITNTKAVILVGNKSDLARTREIAVEGKSLTGISLVTRENVEERLSEFWRGTLLPIGVDVLVPCHV